jgi:glycosyltransferase involved in cell wall biosynthesis
MGLKIEVVDDRWPPSLLRKILKIVKDGKFDVIHCHGSKANVVCALLRDFLKTPIVTTVHSDYRRDYMGKPVKSATNGFLNRIALRFLPYHIGVSDAFADMLVDRNFDPYGIFTIYNGLKFDKKPRMAPQERTAYFEKFGFKVDKDDIVVGIAARLNPVKDIGTLISAFALAAQENPKLKLVIAGEGEEREKLERLAREKNIEKKVCFAGWINDIDAFLARLT